MKKTPQVVITNPNFRPGTHTNLRDYLFKFTLPNEKTAALGDMICWLSSIKFVAEQYNYVAGHLIVPSWFMEVAANVMREYPHWRIHSDVPERFNSGTPMQEQLQNPANATMMHLLDIGAIYFAGVDRLPGEYRQYVELDLTEVALKKELVHRRLTPSEPIKYAVLTPIAESSNRKMTADAFNAICDHLSKLGITPVFLGKTEMASRELSIDPKYDLTKGVNLIDKTTLLEAARVMEDALFVLGIDNGLLHLAGTTDVPIIYGYTLAGPDQRRILRKYGHTMEVYADKGKLPCLFCQEHVRFFFGHNFKECVYKENVPSCVKALNAETWIACIDDMLGEKLGT
jgi:ADP-heptose:LPS heptosyltransferase